MNDKKTLIRVKLGLFVLQVILIFVIFGRVSEQTANDWYFFISIILFTLVTYYEGWIDAIMEKCGKG